MVSAKLARHFSKQRSAEAARDVSSWGDAVEAVVSATHPKQREFVVDDGRRVVALVPRGGGKTTAGRARMVRRMMTTPRARCLFIATTREQASELMWAALKDLLHRLGIEARYNETKLKCTLVRNGSTLRLVGADDKKEIDKLRGQPFHEVGIDEAASHPVAILESLIYRIIGPRLGDFGGSLWMIGTPGHDLRGIFYETTMIGATKSRPWALRDSPEFAGWRSWSSHHWTLEDGASIPAIAANWQEAQLEKELNGWSDDHPIWLREYMAQWAADDTENVYKYRATVNGEPWNQWDPERVGPLRVAKLPEGRSDWIYGYGMDLGHSDPFALTVLAISPSDPTRSLYHHFEFSRKEMYAREIASLLIGPELNCNNPRGIIGETGWPAVMVADTAGLGDALLLELANVYGIQVRPAEKRSKFDSIELSNGDLIDGRVKILKGSLLEQQLKSLQWQIDEFGRLKENKSQRNDQCDSFIYARRHLALYFQEETTRPAPKPRRPDPSIPPEEVEPIDDLSGLLGDYRMR